MSDQEIAKLEQPNAVLVYGSQEYCVAVISTKGTKTKIRIDGWCRNKEPLLPPANKDSILLPGQAIYEVDSTVLSPLVTPVLVYRDLEKWCTHNAFMWHRRENLNNAIKWEEFPKLFQPVVEKDNKKIS